MEGKDVNLSIYIPEQLQDVALKEPKDIIEGLRVKRFKWNFDSEADENYIADLLMSGYIRIPKQSIFILPNDVFNKRRSGRKKSPPKGARAKISNK